ncbi:hypothetical protein Plim_2726 [Planctopirus limnophila DSM 3776]|uniref:Uncharacterized protein n=1 Tax=Planctopirus limnophila (strain ATCC 43296 / DSM 3776 / IFAM 1008 / Mu 290) TaxID=521674 RepID=D5SQT7_PLAL2|nr:hypothetical protein Plim_2726 [Planctopirus limnophila DSM 3776]
MPVPSVRVEMSPPNPRGTGFIPVPIFIYTPQKVVEMRRESAVPVMWYIHFNP